MGKKYIINARNYPYFENPAVVKQTNFIIIAIFWFIIYSIKYNAVDIAMRKEWK